MKLLYTRKQFQGELEKAKKPLNEKIVELNKKISNEEFNYLEEKNKLEEQNANLIETNEYQRKVIELRDSNIAELSKKITKATEEKTEFISKINKLTKQVEEAKVKFEKYREEKEIEIADLKSDRYLKVECEPDKPGKTQKMQIYSKRRTSGIIKNVKEKL